MNQEEQSSRKKRKQFFILFCIIFTLIICAIIAVLTVLKHQIDSESLSNNPMNAICKFTRYHSHCMKSLSSLHNTSSSSHEIQASHVFRLSIDAALQEFLVVYQLPRDLASKTKNKSFRPVLIHCQNLFNHSLSQLNASMIMITRNLYDETMMKDLRALIKHAKNNVEMCVDGLMDVEGTTKHDEEIVEIANAKTKIEEAVIYMMNSLDILENEDSIREVYNPSFRSIFYSLVSGENYVVIAVFCSQYVFLVVLVAFLLKI